MFLCCYEANVQYNDLFEDISLNFIYSYSLNNFDVCLICIHVVYVTHITLQLYVINCT